MVTGPAGQAATAGRRTAIEVRGLRKSFGAVFGLLAVARYRRS
jgi:hypothetical protein